jgi:hypothetical protein
MFHICNNKYLVVSRSNKYSSIKLARIRGTIIEPGASEVIEATGAGEDDEADLGIAKDAELLGLLEQPSPALRERHLPARRVVDPLDLYLPSPHLLLPNSTDLERERES